MKINFVVICCNGDATRRLMLPGKYIICRRCDGTGKHTNPAIDEHGISPQDFDEDPDFRESYFSGVYDVRCEECNGERVIPELCLEQLPKALRKRVVTQMESQELDRQEALHYKRLAAAGIEY